MTTVQIEIPHNLKLDNAIVFAQTLRELSDEHSYDFDFAKMKFIYPFGALYLSAQIRRLKLIKPQITINAINTQNCSYAKNIGFFKACGFECGKEPGEAAGSENYIPITIKTIDELWKESERMCNNIGEAIEQLSNRLAKLMTRMESGDPVDVVSYSFCEIIRNVAEHSQSENVHYCGQFWPGNGTVEIAILDTGIGVKSSLLKNPIYKIETDKEALNLAIKPGVSRASTKAEGRNENDYWANSGFGLYMTSSICKKMGSFFICSGDSGIIIKNAEIHEYNIAFKGTALQLIIDTSKLESFTQVIKELAEEGSKLAGVHSDTRSASISPKKA